MSKGPHLQAAHHLGAPAKRIVQYPCQALPALVPWRTRHGNRSGASEGEASAPDTGAPTSLLLPGLRRMILSRRDRGLLWGLASALARRMWDLRAGQLALGLHTPLASHDDHLVGVSVQGTKARTSPRRLDPVIMIQRSPNMALWLPRLRRDSVSAMRIWGRRFKEPYLLAWRIERPPPLKCMLPGCACRLAFGMNFGLPAECSTCMGCTRCVC